MHGVHQTKILPYAAPINESLDLRGDVDEPASIRYFEPKMFSERLQWSDSLRKASAGRERLLFL